MCFMTCCMHHINFKGDIIVSKVCDNDKYAYQSCVNQYDVMIKYKTNNAKCGGYHCVDKENKT